MMYAFLTGMVSTGHVRKLLVTFGKAVVFSGYSKIKSFIILMISLNSRMPYCANITPKHQRY